MNNNIKMIIAKNICGLRKREKMTQADLAERLFYSDKAVSKWERGESLPDAEMLYEIACLFHVDVQYLFTEHEYLGLTVEEQERLQKRENRYRLLFVFSIVFIIFTMSLSVMASFMEYLEISHLTIGLFFIPLIPAVFLIINLVFGRKRLNLVLISLIIWTLAEAIYIYFSKFNLTIVFAIALILEIAILIWPRFNLFIQSRGGNGKRNKFIFLVKFTDKMYNESKKCSFIFIVTFIIFFLFCQ